VQNLDAYTKSIIISFELSPVKGFGQDQLIAMAERSEAHPVADK
jgi:hypothetical protein